MLGYLALSQKIERELHPALVTCIYGQSVIFDQVVQDVEIAPGSVTMLTAKGIRVSFAGVSCKVIYE